MKLTKAYSRKLIVIGTLVLFASQCSTPYQKRGMRGGYTEERIRYNEFSLFVDINGYTSWDTMVDYTLLRASELSLENGFQYFMLLNSKDRSVFTRQKYDSIRKPETDKGWLKPIVRMFRKEPVFGKDFYYDAREQYASATKKLELSEMAERKFPRDTQAVEPIDLNPQIYFYNENLAIVQKPAKTSLSYYGMEENLADRGIVVGAYLDTERPVADLNVFKQLLAKSIREPKVNAVKIIEDINFQISPHLTAYYRYSVANQFIAQFYAKPEYYLGLKFEPANLADHQMLVRGFYEKSVEKQIQVGDKILKINGIDVLLFQKMVQDWFSWKKDAQIKLEINRGGKTLLLTVPVFANL